MSWAALAIAFLACHLVGDFLLQTEWQANHKFGGLGRDSEALRALLAHLLTYTLAFLPALVWVWDQSNWSLALLATLAIYLPHLVIDDGRLRRSYMVAVKRTPDPPDFWLDVAVDQSMHVVCLVAAALLVAALT